MFPVPIHDEMETLCVSFGVLAWTKLALQTKEAWATKGGKMFTTDYWQSLQVESPDKYLEYNDQVFVLVMAWRKPWQSTAQVGWREDGYLCFQIWHILVLAKTFLYHDHHQNRFTHFICQQRNSSRRISLKRAYLWKPQKWWFVTNYFRLLNMTPYTAEDETLRHRKSPKGLPGKSIMTHIMVTMTKNNHVHFYVKVKWIMDLQDLISMNSPTHYWV